MKVVINSCYGGFGLSHEAIMRIAELKGQTLYPYDLDYNVVDESEIGKCSVIIYSEAAPSASIKEKEKKYITYEGYEPEDRSNPILVQAVEELGSERASANYAELKIVEIPDGINWHIEEYDGLEHVAEDHQTWG